MASAKSGRSDADRMARPPRPATMVCTGTVCPVSAIATSVGQHTAEADAEGLLNHHDPARPGQRGVNLLGRERSETRHSQHADPLTLLAHAVDDVLEGAQH